MREFSIDRLSDEFGQYVIYLACACGHERRCEPRTLANIAGWDARLVDVAKRMRCSKCARRGCRARVVPLRKPGGQGDGSDDVRRGP